MLLQFKDLKIICNDSVNVKIKSLIQDNGQTASLNCLRVTLLNYPGLRNNLQIWLEKFNEANLQIKLQKIYRSQIHPVQHQGEFSIQWWQSSNRSLKNLLKTKTPCTIFKSRVISNKLNLVFKNLKKLGLDWYWYTAFAPINNIQISDIVNSDHQSY